VKIYRDYDQTDLDRQYDQRSRVPDAEDYQAANARASAAARERLDCRLDVAYGEHADERLDIFPAAQSGAPIQVFIHGGAWLRGDKSGSSLVAEGFVAAGVTTIVTGFSLASKVSLDEMVRQNRAAIAWVARNAGQFGGDAGRIHVTGQSSGGHLAAMMLTTDWQTAHRLPAGLIKGGTCLSGIYDLLPVRLSHRNSYLGLDEAAARRNSPIHHIPNLAIPLIVAYAEHDLDEFRRQSREFAAEWRAKGHRCTEIDMAGMNHFENVRALADPTTPLMQAVLAMMGVGPAPRPCPRKTLSRARR
jgi:arylformamidase